MRGATNLVNVEVTSEGALVYQLDHGKLRAVRNREGRYLLRTNLAAHDPEPSPDVAPLLEQLNLGSPAASIKDPDTQLLKRPRSPDF